MLIHGWYVPRRILIKFVPNKLGGSHADGKPDKPDLARLYKALDWTRKSAGLMDKDLVYYELLACGQALSRSEDLNRLVDSVKPYR